MNMDIVLMVFAFAGGVALFLLGMKLLTDGLKLAAGESLRSLLARWTSSMLKGVLSGILVTAIVQSSSAVIFATIGFVNAGVMTLAQAIYVIFGSNVGTTFTGWIIATVGLKINLQLMAMPLLSIGMGLWLTGGNSRRGAWGQALTGFSIFFMGIDVLKTTFTDVGAIVPLEGLDSGWQGIIIMVVIGIILTTIMQSSSAAIAVVITAASGGVIPAHMAAAMVIGADIGTTSTAMLAVIGATANARRSASAHVVFNVVNGLLVLSLLPFYLSAIESTLGSGLSVAMTIAVFHTMKKITGLILLLPLVPQLEAFLNRRFQSHDFQPDKPRYLDNTVLETPSLAVSALVFELKRVGRKTRRLADNALNAHVESAEIQKQLQSLESLHVSIAEFIQKLQRRDLPESLDHALPQALRVLGYFREAADESLASRNHAPDEVSLNPALREKIIQLELDLRKLCHIADSELEGFLLDDVNQLFVEIQDHYESAKQSLLYSSTRGLLAVPDMLKVHDYLRELRRISEQLTKAARHMNDFNELLNHAPGEGPALMEAMHIGHPTS